MSNLPALTEQQVRAYLGDYNTGRGAHYVQSGCFSGLRREGGRIEGNCQGSAHAPYSVSAILGERGIQRTLCSCPVGGDGSCKHVGGLLLAWARDPGAFVDLEERARSLEALSKEQLIALVREIARRFPEVEPLLAKPHAVPGAPGARADTATYREQVAAAFDRTDYDDWSAFSELLGEVERVRGAGDRFRSAGDVANAGVVYAAVVEELIEQGSDIRDEAGNLIGLMAETLSCLMGCFAEPSLPAETRLDWLRVLYEACVYDLKCGGVGISEEVPEFLESETTPEERAAVADWLRDELEETGPGWAAEGLSDLLFALEGDQLSDEEYLEVAREAGNIEAVVGRLLERGRWEEAVRELQDCPDYTLLVLAPCFEECGHVDAIEALLRQRVGRTQDTRVFDWLKQRALSRNEIAEAFRLAEKTFRLRPEIELYRELRALARQCGEEDGLADRMLACLPKWQVEELRPLILLEEGRLDQALADISKQAIRPYAGTTADSETVLAVAAAAEADRPEAAIRIYQRWAEALIAQRGRDSYQEASVWLRKVKELYARLHQLDRWATYFTRIVEENHRLTALREELRAAGLNP